MAALAVFASCKKESVSLSIAGPEEFTDGKATVVLRLSSAPADFVDVLLACSPEEGVVMQKQVSFNPGSTTLEVPVDATGITASSVINVEVRIVDAIGASVGHPSSHVIVLNPGNEGNEGNEGDNTLQLQGNWKVELAGEPYSEDGSDWVDVKVTAPGIKNFYVDVFLESDIASVEGGIAAVIADWESQIKSALANGEALTDYLWTSVEEECWIEYPGAGNANIYVVEFESDGSATGRYGLTKVVLPEYEGDSDSSTLQPADNYVKNSKIGVTYMGRYNDEGDDFDCFTATGVEGKLWSISIDEPGTFADIAQAAEYAIGEIEDLLADYAAFGFTALDFLYQGTLAEDEYSIAEYYAFDNGTYDAIVFIFDEEGKMTGEYNLVSVNIDGHAKASAPRPAGKRRVLRRS